MKLKEITNSDDLLELKNMWFERVVNLHEKCMEMNPKRVEHIVFEQQARILNAMISFNEWGHVCIDVKTMEEEGLKPATKEKLMEMPFSNE